MLKSNEWLQRDRAALAGVLQRCTEIVAIRGEGSYLWDIDGNKILDFTSGIGTTNTGHCHASVVLAVQEQVSQLIHTSVTVHHTKSIELAEKLGGLCSFFSEPRVFFANSGAEVVDGSLKLARIATGRPGVISFSLGFHGRTLACTSLTTAKKKYREGYEPLMPNVYIAPYGSNLGAIDWALQMHSHIGAMIVEPVLGEGGYLPAPVEWLRGLREKCNQHGILLIFDEVQCGMGRTGYPFAAETFGVTPDILLSAKALASGLPIGAIIAEKSLMDKWPTGSHGSTFGANPVSCASALATLDVLAPLYERVRVLGVSVLDRLRDSLPYPVRGIGLMIGIELPSKRMCSQARLRCQEEGLLVLSCGPGDDVIRLIPPLTISDEELDQGLSILEKVLNAPFELSY